MRHGLTQQDCEGETLFMFVAGSETTAAVIRVTMLHILSNPRVYHKLKEEIRQAIVDGKVSDPITNAEGRALPYLQVRFPGAGINLNPRTDLLKAVIYEGLRIRPVVSGLMLKEVPAGGDTIDGKFIPAGTCIGTNLPSFLRSKVVFGNDADIFRPERFLELDPDALAEMHRSVEMQFGYGRWMCAGRPLAQMELNKVYFEVSYLDRMTFSSTICAWL